MLLLVSSNSEASVHGHEIFKLRLPFSLLQAFETEHCTLHMSVRLLISSMCSTLRTLTLPWQPGLLNAISILADYLKILS